RHGLSRARRFARRGCGGYEARTGAGYRRRSVRARNAFGDDPGRGVQANRQTTFLDGADPPPFREARLAGTDYRHSLLDYLGDFRARGPGHAEAALTVALTARSGAHPHAHDGLEAIG